MGVVCIWTAFKAVGVDEVARRMCGRKIPVQRALGPSSSLQVFSTILVLPSLGFLYKQDPMLSWPLNK